MARPYPNVDVDDEENHILLWRTEWLAYPDGSGVAFDSAIAVQHLEGFRRVYISLLMQDVIERWNLGTSMVDIADRLGVDHSQISRALRWGEMSSSLETFITACPQQPDDWRERIKPFLAIRQRRAYMTVAEYLYDRIHGKTAVSRNLLLEVQTEWVFEAMEHKVEWDRAVRNCDTSAASTMISAVCEDSSAFINPPWHIKARRKQVNALSRRLNADPALAFQYLCALHKRWAGIFLLTRAATETIVWL